MVKRNGPAVSAYFVENGWPKNLLLTRLSAAPQESKRQFRPARRSSEQ
jgi:hypothetical protein